MSQVAEQEFYDELDRLLAKQVNEWTNPEPSQNTFWLSPSDFTYYVEIRQRSEQSSSGELQKDSKDVPVVYYRGIRVKPLKHE